jgi:hypothetical protein
MTRIKTKAVTSELFTGLLIITISYLPHTQPERNYGFWGSLFFGAAYYLGAILLANFAIRLMSGRSMFSDILGTRENRWSFIKLGLLGAIPFSLGISTFGGLWYFPHWSATDYYVLGFVLLGWVFYFFFLTICYIAFKLALDILIPQRHVVGKYYKFERKYFRALGVVGGWMAIMVITVALQNSHWLTNFNVEVNKPQTPYLYWYWWLIAVIAWILLCEYIEYRRQRTSLFKDTLHKYYTPLIAIILCGVTLAITNEVQNLPINLWHYANFPWTSFQIYKIPLFIVVCWPVQILATMEFWRAFGDKKATDILYANANQYKPARKHSRKQIRSKNRPVARHA